jgi:hypothetical protein
MLLFSDRFNFLLFPRRARDDKLLHFDFYLLTSLILLTQYYPYDRFDSSDSQSFRLFLSLSETT